MIDLDGSIRIRRLRCGVYSVSINNSGTSHIVNFNLNTAYQLYRYDTGSVVSIKNLLIKRSNNIWYARSSVRKMAKFCAITNTYMSTIYSKVYMAYKNDTIEYQIFNIDS